MIKSKEVLPVLLGGEKSITTELKSYSTIGKEERNAVDKVFDNGVLSGFIGAWCPEFYGGENVKKLEDEWKEYFNVKHAVTVNSATSGLYASIAAIGVEPGDEVIVTPTTMTATITGIILYQAIPVFADVSRESFCIDPVDIENKITSKTKAIIGVDIYGKTADWNSINRIAKKYNLHVIEDSAQSIGGTYLGKKSGTLADIGIYSLNRHKHIHCGEGGVCVTDSDLLADRLRLIRNHGEAVVDDMPGVDDISGLLGFNFRMTEIEAAIARSQLKKLEFYVKQRRDTCHKIIRSFLPFDGIVPPDGYRNDFKSSISSSSDTTHVYYYLCFLVDEKKLGMSRDDFVTAMNAEGVPLGSGGYKPIYLQAMFQKKIAFGKDGLPFTSTIYGKSVNYKTKLCPVAEDLWFKSLFYVKVQNYTFTDDQILEINKAAEKVLSHKDEINLILNK